MPRWALFLSAGVFNTIASYAVYLISKQFLDYNVAYLIAYVAGIAISYCMNAVWVFRVPLSWTGFLSFPLVYLIQYSASAALLIVFVEKLHVADTLAPLLITVITIPITYAMSKIVLLKTWHKSFRLRKSNKHEQP